MSYCRYSGYQGTIKGGLRGPAGSLGQSHMYSFMLTIYEGKVARSLPRAHLKGLRNMKGLPGHKAYTTLGL